MPFLYSALQLHLLAVITAGTAGAFAGVSTGAFAATDPLVPGDAFHYEYTQSAVFQQPGTTAKPYSAKGKFTASISGGASFAGHVQLARLHYTGLGPSIDEYVGFTPLGGGRMEQRSYGWLLSAGPGVTTLTIPAGSIQSEYPEAKGLAWSPAADSMTLDQPAGTSSPDEFTKLAFADGSYHWSQRQQVNGGVEGGTASLAPDGSGKLTWKTPGYNTGTTTFGTPVKLKTGFTIPVTSQGFNKLPQPPAKPTTVDVPDWFPGSALPLRPLQLETETNNGVVTAPAACGLRAGLKAFDLRTSTRSLDPLTGLVNETTVDEFDVVGFGNVCTISKNAAADYENTITGNLLVQGTTTTIVVLTGISGPKPPAEAFSLDVSPVPAVYSAVFYPTPINPSERRYRPSLPKSEPT